MQPNLSVPIFAETADFKYSPDRPLKQRKCIREPRTVALNLAWNAQKFHPVSNLESRHCHLTELYFNDGQSFISSGRNCILLIISGRLQDDSNIRTSARFPLFALRKLFMPSFNLLRIVRPFSVDFKRENACLFGSFSSDRLPPPADYKKIHLDSICPSAPR